jgi:hypothetical protein
LPEPSSAQYRFHNALAEGDLCEALGLRRNASGSDVAVAGARLAEQMPSIAQEVNTLVDVLTNRQRKMVYYAVRELCDGVMDTFLARHGPGFANAFSDYRGDLWRRCCRVFQFDLDHGNQVLGPRGIESLIRNGQAWIVRDFLEARVSAVPFTERELRYGMAGCDVWHTRCMCGTTRDVFYLLRPSESPGRSSDEGVEPPPRVFRAEDYEIPRIHCPRCGGSAVTPLHFEGRFRFSLPPTVARGDVIQGEGVYGAGTTFVIVDRGTALSATQLELRRLLPRFFDLQNRGQDVAIEEVNAVAVYGSGTAHVDVNTVTDRSDSQPEPQPPGNRFFNLQNRGQDVSIWEVEAAAVYGADTRPADVDTVTGPSASQHAIQFTDMECNSDSPVRVFCLTVGALMFTPAAVACIGVFAITLLKEGEYCPGEVAYVLAAGIV